MAATGGNLWSPLQQSTDDDVERHWPTYVEVMTSKLKVVHVNDTWHCD